MHSLYSRPVVCVFCVHFCLLCMNNTLRWSYTWMKHFPKWSFITPLRNKCLLHLNYNLTNKLCAFVICKQTKESKKSSECLLDPESFVFYWTQVLRHWCHRHVLLNFWRMRIRSCTFWKEWWREKSNNCNDDRTGEFFFINKRIFFYDWFSRIIIIINLTICWRAALSSTKLTLM